MVGQRLVRAEICWYGDGSVKMSEIFFVCMYVLDVNVSGVHMVSEVVNA